MSLRTNIIIGVVVGIALLVGGYLFFFNTDSTSNSALSASGPNGAVSEVEQNFIELASKANAITFDTTILTNPHFTNLKNTHTPLTPVPTGRPDPFAPLQ